tara:strand:- start:16 stop:237 length:222 start_codon:yes stop_codon:yes gene_type:complete
MDYDDMITCDHCSRVWDGNAQCPCILYLSDEESPRPKFTDVSTQTKKIRVWGPNKLQIAQEAVDKKFAYYIKK